MKLVNNVRILKSGLFAAAAAVLITATPAAAAVHHAPRHRAVVSHIGPPAQAPASYANAEEGCYETRIQVPVFGGGLAWVPEMMCDRGE